MTNLSPVAQAVLGAIESHIDRCAALAAALRVAADFLAYKTQVDDPMMTAVRVIDVDDLLIIANELEQQS